VWKVFILTGCKQTLFTNHLNGYIEIVCNTTGREYLNLYTDTQIHDRSNTSIISGGGIVLWAQIFFALYACIYGLHDHVCKGYRLCLFIRFVYWILELFRTVSHFLFLVLDPPSTNLDILICPSRYWNSDLYWFKSSTNQNSKY
jgi:hypothetical protein